jgi:hypothetical protein
VQGGNQPHATDLRLKVRVQCDECANSGPWLDEDGIETCDHCDGMGYHEQTLLLDDANLAALALAISDLLLANVSTRHSKMVLP